MRPLLLHPFRSSLLVTLTALVCVYLVLINHRQVTRAELHYTLDGSTPWGGEARRDASGLPPVLLYQRDSPTTYCFDALYYEPLRQQLLASHPATVSVEYESFRSSWLEPMYNVRSIDGILLVDGEKMILDEAESGTMEVPDQAHDGGPIHRCPR